MVLPPTLPPVMLSVLLPYLLAPLANVGPSARHWYFKPYMKTGRPMLANRELLLDEKVHGVVIGFTCHAFLRKILFLISGN
eukprot:IDg7924t1